MHSKQARPRRAANQHGRLTAIVEPDWRGHRFQWVQHIARAALWRGDRVVLLTGHGATQTEEYQNFLGDLPVIVDECFEGIGPSAEDVADALLAVHRMAPLSTYVIPEADQIFKRWWTTAPKALRHRRGGPDGVLVYARFPSRVALTDRHALQHRVAKTTFAALNRLTGSAARTVALVGRDELEPGWMLKRARDPAICTAHARDRIALRERYGLPQDRRIVSILGLLSMRKCVPQVLDAVLAAGPDVDLLLAGELFDDVKDWLADLEPAKAARIIPRYGFLSEADIDGYTAASDICATAHLNKGPSGIMGKAQVAGVPVLSAGSVIRGKEVEALGGIHTELTGPAMGVGIRTLLDRGSDPLPVDPLLPTAEEFGITVLGIPLCGCGRAPLPEHKLHGAGRRRSVPAARLASAESLHFSDH